MPAPGFILVKLNQLNLIQEEATGSEAAAYRSHAICFKCGCAANLVYTAVPWEHRLEGN
jgi:hypothetical protein